MGNSDTDLVKFGAALFVADAVLGVISQQHLHDFSVCLRLAADTEVERC